MALPKIDVPTYELTIPSNQKKITVRPFLVKEEKLLLIASESKDPLEVIKTTHQIINNCIVDGDVDITKLPFFDIDYLIIALRAKSISETVTVSYRCNHIVDGNSCNEQFKAVYDVLNAEVQIDKEIEDTVKIDGAKGIKLKYPTYSAMKVINDDDNAFNKKIRLIANCIDYIYDKDQIYPAKDHTREELFEFIENLTEITFKKLEKFIENLPTFMITTKATCDKCGFEHKLYYDSFESFFI